MVLTLNQTLLFFKEADQMVIPFATVLQLLHEGIDTVLDLVEFDRLSIKQIADNLMRPGGRVPKPSPRVTVGANIPTPPFVFGAKSQTRIEVAYNLIRFYETIGRPLRAAKLKWGTIIHKFGLLWKLLEARQFVVHPTTPLITKELPIMKWIEVFEDHLHCCIGFYMIPLSYITYTDVGFAPLCLSLKTDELFFEEWGMIEMNMIVRASHNHVLYS